MTRLRRERAASKTVGALLLALCASCAGGQKPSTPNVAAPAEAPPPPAPRTGLDGEAPAVLTVPAKDSFADGVKKETAGDLSGAAAAFERAYQNDPIAAFAGVNAGVLRERLGDDPGALSMYGKVLDQNPTFFPAAQNLVRLLGRKGKGAEAEAQMRERLSRKPEAVALQNGLAEALLLEGKVDAAEEAARKALKMDERNVPAMVSLATVYARKQRFELAKMVLENARQVDGKDASIWNRLGFVELALGDRPQALESFRTAAALRPDYPEAHANYGALLADAEDFSAAATELELAVRYAPQSAQAWLDLGNAYRGLKEFDKAEEAYRKSMELNPGQIDCQFNLAVLYLDGDKPGLPALQRLQKGVAYLDAYEQGGGKDPQVAAYRKDAARAIEREKKRIEREEKDRLRREAEAKKKSEAVVEPVAGAPAAAPSPAAAPAQADPAADKGATAPAQKAAASPKKKGAAKKVPVKAQADKVGTAPQGAERGDK